MQLCFVSVHGPRETYFVDEPRIQLILLQFRAIPIVYEIFQGRSFSNVNQTQFHIKENVSEAPNSSHHPCACFSLMS
jgi:hypothetical protein